MKKILFSLSLLVLMVSCNNPKENNKENQPEKAEEAATIPTVDVKDKSFDELFKSIKETEIPESVFKLVGSDFTVITSGTETDYNSMVASWGGWGILFNKPVTWCFLRANRYTLEYIKKEKTYTMAYFDEQYKEQVMFLGSKTGRDSEKMKENTLTFVKMPSGNISYKEAKLIIECKLTEVTSVKPEDFLNQENKDFVTEAYGEAKDYHKLVLGDITGVWVRK